MTILDDLKLDEYETEDISDVLVKLEKSFAIKFPKDAFMSVKTFGELCDIIESNIKFDNKEDCTKQQAFYKIRTAICETQNIDKSLISLETKLADVFLRRNRRRQVKRFQKHLGIDLEFLTYPDWLLITFIVGIFCSLIAFFFDWKVAVAGMAFFIIALKVADKLGKDLKFDTVKELTEKAATEHYVHIRRSNSTVNRQEILDTIKEAFSAGLAIDKEQLTRDAKFSWA
jgi:hypothetical protein